MRRVARAIVTALLSPPALGAAYLLALAASAGSGPLVDEQERVLGKDTGRVVRLVVDVYGGEIRRITLEIAATAIVLGALLGLLAWALVALRARVLGRPRRAPLALALRALPLLAALHAWLFLVSLTRSPQLYDATWYRGEPWARAVQLFATDVAGPRPLALAGALFFTLYTLGLPHTLLAGPAGLRRAARTLTRLLRRHAGKLLALAAAGLLLALPSSTWQRPRAARSARPSVLVLAADSLRHDRLDPAHTPTLAALADRSVRFERAYSSLPRTFSSWTTLLTGRYPHHHGVRSMFARWEERARDLDTLPSRLSREGYRTAVVSDYAGDMFGLADFGFARRDTPVFSAREFIRKHALERETPLLPFLHSRLGRRVFPALRGLHQASDAGMLADDVEDVLCRADDRPFFLTVFFSTTHFPYAAPWPYYARRTDPSYRGPFKYDKAVAFSAAAMTDADVRQVRALYDGAVASVDDAAAHVLAALRRCGHADSTIVVVTADHGEMLFEPGHIQGHGDTLIGDEVLHVPLVVHDPRLPEARRVDAITRDVDLAPTLYDLTGTTPPADLDGRSLAPALRGAPLPPLPAFAESELWLNDGADVPADLRLPYPTLGRLLEVDLDHADQVVVHRELTPVTLVARHRMVRDDRWKLVYAPLRAGTRYLLFDTAHDPAEQHDVAATEPQQVDRLKATLWHWMLEDPAMTERDGRLVPRDTPTRPSSCVRLLFAAAGPGHRVTGHVSAKGAQIQRVDRILLPEAAVKQAGADLDLAFTTRHEPVGIVLHVTSPGAAITWDLRLDDAPLAAERVFSGPYGFAAPALRGGLASPEAWSAAYAPAPLEVDARRESGLFVATGCDDDPEP